MKLLKFIFSLVFLSATCCCFKANYNLESWVRQLLAQGEKNSTSVINKREDCVCVPFYLCRTDIHGKYLSSSNVTCNEYLRVCCRQDGMVSTKSGCGYRKKDGIDEKFKALREDQAHFGEFPWVVAILRQLSSPFYSFHINQLACGGALLHPKVVITAATCVSKNFTILVRAGEWDNFLKNETYPYQDRSVKKIIRHPSYVAKGQHNDVALLVLEKPFLIDENVDVICLPPPHVSVNGDCFVSGWGKDSFDREGKYAIVPKKIKLGIVRRDRCSYALRSTRLGPAFSLHSSFICAGGQFNKDTCKGDGGNALVCPMPHDPDRYYQVGIVSWGIGCGGNQIPGVYTNVGLFRNWIDHQFSLLKLDYSYIF